MVWDKVSLGISWSTEESGYLPVPGVIAVEIVENLESAMGQMRLIAEGLNDTAEIST